MVMKSLKSKEALDGAKRWFALKKKISELTQELDEIKEFFASEVEEGEAVLCGKFVIGCTPFTRSSLDRELILKRQGQAFVDECTKVTEYVKLDIKVAG